MCVRVLMFTRTCTCNAMSRSSKEELGVSGWRRGNAEVDGLSRHAKIARSEEFALRPGRALRSVTSQSSLTKYASVWSFWKSTVASARQDKKASDRCLLLHKTQTYARCPSAFVCGGESARYWILEGRQDNSRRTGTARGSTRERKKQKDKTAIGNRTCQMRHAGGAPTPKSQLATSAATLLRPISSSRSASEPWLL